MTSDGRTVAAVYAAISSADQRDSAPEQRRWKGYWTKYWCFGSQKRENRIVPTARPHGASDSARGWSSAQAVLALVPPSSPASFVNSSAQSPASFTLSLSAASGGMCSPGPTNMMFTIGPYAHETQLVSPPVFSTFTTEPSTAPLTPPPEPAHHTTPSSPDVPFAQYIASSLKAKAAARETISPVSTSTLASPCDTPASYTPRSGHLYLGRGGRISLSPRSTSNLASPCETPASYTPTSIHLYPKVVRDTIHLRSSTLALPCDTPVSSTPTSKHLYFCNPVGRLASSSMEYARKDITLEDTLPTHSDTSLKNTNPSFLTYDPFASPKFDHAPVASLILPSDAVSKPGDLSEPVVSVSDVGKDSVFVNEACNSVPKYAKELDLSNPSARASGSLLVKEHNSSFADGQGGAPEGDIASFASSKHGGMECTRGCADSNGGTIQSDITPSLSSIDSQKRFQKSLSCEFDGNSDIIFLSAGNNRDWNGSVENSQQLDSSHSLKDAGDERLAKLSAILYPDTSHSAEYAGDGRLDQSGAAPQSMEG